MMFSRYIHFLANDRTFVFVLYDWIRPHCIYRHIFCIHLSVEGHQGWVHSLAVVNYTTVNTGTQVSLSSAGFCFFRYLPMSSIARSNGNSIFSLLRNLRIGFQHGCTNLQSYHCCKMVPPPHILLRLLFSVFLMIAVLIGWDEITVYF